MGALAQGPPNSEVLLWRTDSYINHLPVAEQVGVPGIGTVLVGGLRPTNRGYPVDLLDPTSRLLTHFIAAPQTKCVVERPRISHAFLS
jgi:hypothetical protein